MVDPQKDFELDFVTYVLKEALAKNQTFRFYLLSTVTIASALTIIESANLVANHLYQHPTFDLVSINIRYR